MVMENKINTTVVAAIIIAVGLIGMGLAVRCGIVKFKKLDGTVSVKGLSEMEMPADKVIWPISYVAAGDDLTSLYSNIESKNAIITKFLLDNGISKDEITESAPVVTDLKAQSSYGDNRSRPPRPAPTCPPASPTRCSPCRRCASSRRLRRGSASGWRTPRAASASPS